jgi:hypothetical protein
VLFSVSQWVRLDRKRREGVGGGGDGRTDRPTAGRKEVWIATFGLTSAEQEEMAMAVVTMVAMRVDPKIAAMQREGRCRRRQLLWQLQGLH